MTLRTSIEEAIRLLDEVQIALVVEDSVNKNISMGIFDNLAKATSLIERLYYDTGAEENGETQPLNFD